jgi:hypothetical protein
MGQQHSRMRACSGEHGQAVLFVVLFLVTVIAVVGIVIDVGYAFRAQRSLQGTADAAALAGAQQLPDPTKATQIAQQYGSGASGKNRLADVTVAEQVTTACIASIPGCKPVNSVSVTESATVPTFFSKIIGFNSFKVHANATACSPCGSKPVDIMLVLDRTGSMCQDSNGNTDPACTDLNNAKAGIRTFLGFFDPTQTKIGLAVLPPASTVSARCNTPNQTDYNSKTAAYLLVGLSNDYKLANGTLNSSSNLVSTVNCIKGAGTTSYAQAIEAAQGELDAHGRPNVPKVIVFFSDGAANTGPNYLSTTSPYRKQPCHQGVTSAGVAKTKGSTVYSIGYALDDDTGGCRSYDGTVEKPAITVYQALGGIASDSTKFLVKPNPGELQTIYSTIAMDISQGSSSLIN